MLNSKAKTKVESFLEHIELLGQNSADRVVDGFMKMEKELLRQFIDDTFSLIEHNEWGIGLENLLTNIYEIEFTIDNRAVELAKEAIDACGMDYLDWRFIEELVK